MPFRAVMKRILSQRHLAAVSFCSLLKVNELDVGLAVGEPGRLALTQGGGYGAAAISSRLISAIEAAAVRVWCSQVISERRKRQRS